MLESFLLRRLRIGGINVSMANWLRQYGFTAASVFLLLALSWYYMVYLMTMNMAPVESWSYYDIFALFVMWSIMMVGMMLPSALPVLMLVQRTNQQRKRRETPYTKIIYFLLGYFIAWVTYCVLITAIQWWLHELAILSPMMSSQSTYFNGVLLIAAGLYQLSSFKERCLRVCRSPLSIITSHWQEGQWGAISMGFKHGQYCLGCCWILMALLFVVGVMNLHWIVVFTLWILVEKLMPYGVILGKVLGGLLIITGFAYFAS